MKKALLDVIFASDKRKEALLLLADRPKEMESLLSSLDTTRQSLLPQMRILEEHYLVDHSGDTYSLTDIGHLIMNRAISLLDSVDVFESDVEYWGTRELEFIPPHLLKRIGELGKCKVLNPPLTEIHYIHSRFHETNKKSDSLFVVTTFFFANYINLFRELIANNTETYFIISTELLEKLHNDASSSESLKESIESDLFHLYAYDKKMNTISFAFNDYCILMRTLTIERKTDHKILVCYGSGAVEWARELFDHYMKDTRPVTGLS